MNPQMVIAVELERPLQEKTARIAVVGLGHVGHPLAERFVATGFDTVGIDTDEIKVDEVNSHNGGAYCRDSDLVASKSYDAINNCQAVCICVPTGIDQHLQPDLAHIKAATEEVAKRLQPGQLIVVESTVFPGATEELILPILSKSGLSVGRDYYLGYSPNRIDPGNEWHDLRTIPKLVSGVTDTCQAMTIALYTQIADNVIPVSTTQVAEMAKLLENMFRNVNIALVNELALFCEQSGINIWEVIEAAATKPFGFMKFTPGPGVGGHCIPVDPLYLSWCARKWGFQIRFVELASSINSRMPEHVVSKVVNALNTVGKPVKGSAILVLGVAYKPNVGDTRHSPAFLIMERLRLLHAEVIYNDPYVPSISHKGLILESVALDKEVLQRADCVLLVTNHRDYPHQRIANQAKLIVDTRNALQTIPGRIYTSFEATAIVFRGQDEPMPRSSLVVSLLSNVVANRAICPRAMVAAFRATVDIGNPAALNGWRR